jgi:hypothetical protein
VTSDLESAGSRSAANFRFIAGRSMLVCCIALGLSGTANSIFAEEPESPAPVVEAPVDPIPELPGWAEDLLRSARLLEAAEMVLAVNRGDELGPGAGWFHPGEIRHGFESLARRFDANADGSLDADELKVEVGNAQNAWARLDRDQDGFVRADDFDWSDGSKFEQETRRAWRWFRAADSSSNGRISASEWSGLFAKLAAGKDYLSMEDVRNVLRLAEPAPTSSGTSSGGEPSAAVFINAFLRGELGSFGSGPELGESAPDFELETPDTSAKISLSSFRGKKPVVLVFGSFT